MRLLMVIMVLVSIAMALPVSAQSWDSGLTSGFTGVEATLSGDTWTFVLSNQSIANTPERDVLVWSFEPFNIPDPAAVTTPDGWVWQGTGWEQYVVESNKKYFTPPALGPGEKYTFTLTFEPIAAIINPESSTDGLGFLCHVGAVIPDPGSTDGTYRWQEVETGYGNTWHDESVVPEPSGLMAFGTGLFGLLGVVTKRRK